MSSLKKLCRPRVPIYLFLMLIIFVIPVATHPAMATTGSLVITSNTTLTEDHFGTIIIAADNVILNCNSHAVTGPGSGFGITLTNRVGVAVENCIVTRFDVGIALTFSNQTFLVGNVVTNTNSAGIFLGASSNNTLISNVGAMDGFPTFGAAFDIDHSSDNNVVLFNTANDNHEGFFVGDSSRNIFINNTADRNGVTSGGGGFIFQSSSSNFLIRNTANNNRVGFFVGNDPTFPSNNNFFILNNACGNISFDAIQGTTSTGNVFIRNSFCTTLGI